MRTIALLPVRASVLLSGCAVHHSEGWKRADLDRNRFNLGLHRGALSGAELATWTNNGETVGNGGSAERATGGDLYVVVKYNVATVNPTFGDAELEDECWRFTTPDGYDVEFRRVTC